MVRVVLMLIWLRGALWGLYVPYQRLAVRPYAPAWTSAERALPSFAGVL